MADLTTFDFAGRKVRTSGTHESPLFCAADVCPLLGYDSAAPALRRLDQDEQEMVCVDGPSGRKNAVFVTESGLFTLILGSKKPEAKAFKKWVTSEVLPAIRRKGYYSALEAEQEKQTERLLAECFPKLPSKSAPIFRELIAALIRLRRQGETGNPPWARTLASLVYGWAIRIDGEQPKRRSLNPRPNGSHIDHSMLSGAARESVLQVIHVGIAFASHGVSVTWEDWRMRMELHFGNKPVQLEMRVSLRSLSGGKGAA